jgi:hypothetical protein
MANVKMVIVVIEFLAVSIYPKFPRILKYEVHRSKEKEMRPIKWSRNKVGNLNGKVGYITMFCVSYHPERRYFITPKLPGLNKTINVSSELEGCQVASKMYKDYLDFLIGAKNSL